MSYDSIGIRRHLHAHPELSGKESKTSAYIADELQKMGWENITVYDNYGVCAFIGSRDKPTVLIRADFDALPIAENLSAEYQSTVDGVSHKCGHDGHTAILLDVAHRLKNHQPEQISIALLFQPAEEIGAGARGILSDSKWNIRPKKVFALHNIPGIPLGTITSRNGAFSASVRTFVIELNGISSHAAEPENGVNPARAMSEITRYFGGIENRNKGDKYRLITPVYQRLGERAYGTSPGFGEMAFTVRTYSEHEMQNTVNLLEKYIQMTASAFLMEVEMKWEEIFPACTNGEESVKTLQEVAKKQGLAYQSLEHPFSWGEDFGFFLNEYQGAMFGIGSGAHTAPLHHPDYDFPDDLIAPAASFFTELIHHIDQNDI